MHMRGWGWLIALALPLGLVYVWFHMGSRTGDAQLERYKNFVYKAPDIDPMTRMRQYLSTHKRLPGPGDVDLGTPPDKSGVKRWEVQTGGVLRVEIDAKVQGQPVVLMYVPILANGQVNYDCVSDAPLSVIRPICEAYTVRSVADIPAQLAANAQAAPAPAVKGDANVPAGIRAGSVYVPPVPGKGDCGYQCVQNQSCVDARPLACAKHVTEKISEGVTSGTVLIVPTGTAYRGTDLASAEQANGLCVQEHGEGYKLIDAASLWGQSKLDTGREYWVNNTVDKDRNCWAR